MSENVKYIVAIAGVALLGVFFVLYTHYDDITLYLEQKTNKEVHVHSDFLFTAFGAKVDLTGPQYQSNKNQILHKYMHFHDGVDTMIHRHADGVTLADFFASLGFELTDTCITTDSNTSYCTDTENALRLYVNGAQVNDIANYITQEKDQILFYYGPIDDIQIQGLEKKISTDACLYSGTCPERGKPPFESCGLTCEI